MHVKCPFWTHQLAIFYLFVKDFCNKMQAQKRTLKNFLEPRKTVSHRGAESQLS